MTAEMPPATPQPDDPQPGNQQPAGSFVARTIAPRPAAAGQHTPVVRVERPVAPPPRTVSAHEANPADQPTEFGGPTGPEPTRFGDWERKGRCSDF